MIQIICIILTLVLQNQAFASQGSNTSLENQMLDFVKLEKIISSLNLKIKNLVKLQNQINFEVINLESSISSMGEQILNLETDLLNSKSQMRFRANLINKSSGLIILSGLESSQNPNDLVKYFKVVSKLAKRDVKLIKELKMKKRSLSQSKSNLIARLEVQKKKQAEMDQVEKQLNSELELKSKLYSKLRSRRDIQRKDFLALLDAAKENGGAGVEIYQSLLKPTFFEQKGNLQAPLRNAYEIQSFGKWQDRENKVSTFIKGIYLGSETDAKVYPIDEGIVMFSGLVPGYGSVVILSHGNEYSTVYGHLKKVNITIGQKIGRDRSIGEVSPNSFVFKKGLYFELRHFSEPINPINWISGLAQADKKENLK